MKSILKPASALLLLAILVAASVTGQEMSEDRTMEEESIKEALAIYVETWNKHDMDAWGKLFTDDVDYVNRGGGWWKSNRENVEGHKAIHEVLIKQKQKMTYRSDVARITLLKPDIALVHATWEWPYFKLPSGEEMKDFRGIITMVMVKREGKWLIRALQNTATTNPSPVSEQPKNGE